MSGPTWITASAARLSLASSLYAVHFIIYFPFGFACRRLPELPRSINWFCVLRIALRHRHRTHPITAVTSHKHTPPTSQSFTTLSPSTNMLNTRTPTDAHRTRHIPNPADQIQRRDEEFYARTAYAFDEYRRWIDGEPLSPLSTQESYTFPDPSDPGPPETGATASIVPYKPRYITVNKAFEILPTPPDAQRPRIQPPSQPAQQPYIDYGGRVVGYVIETDGRIVTLVEGGQSLATFDPISDVQNISYIADLAALATSAPQGHGANAVDRIRAGEVSKVEQSNAGSGALRSESY